MSESRVFHFQYDHGTIIQAGTTCKKILSSKSIELGITLKKITARYKKKSEIFLVTRSPPC